MSFGRRRAETAAELAPDVVLTDNSLPGMSGHELINALKESAPDLKLIMMTGYGNIEDAVTAMKEGAFHYLTKPVALPELKLLLDKALAAERMERTLSFYQDRDAKQSGVQALDRRLGGHDAASRAWSASCSTPSGA